MSSTETETEETTPPEPLLPVTDIDDLFADEPEEIPDPVIPDDLSDDELRARVVKAEKSATYERNQRLAVARKTWVTEAKQHFPYSSPDSITADSRRTFLEAAKSQDADFRERAKPILELAEQKEEEIRTKIQEEEATKAANAWGTPHNQGGAGVGNVTEEQTEKRLDSAYKRRDLVEAAKALMDGKRI